MKVIIEHDSRGNIQLVVVPVSTGTEVRTTLRAQPGNSLTEFEVPEVRHEKDLENLRAIKRLYIVKASGGTAVLKRKAS